MSYLLQTVDILQCRIFRLIYIDDNSKGKQTNFLYYTQSLFLLKITMKKPFRQTQTLRAASNKTEPTIFAPTQTPFAPRRTGKILSAAAVYIQPELSVGPFSWTQPNPTHQIIGPTQPNPLLGELMDP